MSHTYIDQVGNIPIVAVQLDESHDSIWCKLEFMNPSGSIKDRIASYILQKALRQKVIAKGSLVVEASSGSTSIALALACAQFDLEFVAIMPVGVSKERIMMIEAYGAEVRLSPKRTGMLGAIALAEAMVDERGAFWPHQFSNPDNVETHRNWTAHEIANQLPAGDVSAVVSGVGTGGTLVGLYQGLCDHGYNVVPVVARPTDAGMLSSDPEQCSFSVRVPGVAEGLSKLYCAEDFVNLVEIDVSANLAYETTRRLIRRGFPVGPSSGLNYAAAVLAQQRGLCPPGHIVTVFPDRMERYFSTELFYGGSG